MKNVEMKVQAVTAWVRYLTDFQLRRGESTSILVSEPAFVATDAGYSVSPIGVFYLASPDWTVRETSDGYVFAHRTELDEVVPASVGTAILARHAGVPAHLALKACAAVGSSGKADAACRILLDWVRAQGSGAGARIGT